MMDITDHPVIRTLLENLGKLEQEQKKNQGRIKQLGQQVKELEEKVKELVLAPALVCFGGLENHVVCQLIFS